MLTARWLPLAVVLSLLTPANGDCTNDWETRRLSVYAYSSNKAMNTDQQTCSTEQGNDICEYAFNRDGISDKDYWKPRGNDDMPWATLYNINNPERINTGRLRCNRCQNYLNRSVKLNGGSITIQSVIRNDPFDIRGDGWMRFDFEPLFKHETNNMTITFPLSGDDVDDDDDDDDEEEDDLLADDDKAVQFYEIELHSPNNRAKMISTAGCRSSTSRRVRFSTSYDTNNPSVLIRLLVKACENMSSPVNVTAVVTATHSDGRDTVLMNGIITVPVIDAGAFGPAILQELPRVADITNISGFITTVGGSLEHRLEIFTDKDDADYTDHSDVNIECSSSIQTKCSSIIDNNLITFAESDASGATINITFSQPRDISRLRLKLENTSSVVVTTADNCYRIMFGDAHSGALSEWTTVQQKITMATFVHFELFKTAEKLKIYEVEIYGKELPPSTTTTSTTATKTSTSTQPTTTPSTTASTTSKSSSTSTSTVSTSSITMSSTTPPTTQSTQDTFNHTTETTAQMSTSDTTSNTTELTSPTTPATPATLPTTQNTSDATDPTDLTIPTTTSISTTETASSPTQGSTINISSTTGTTETTSSTDSTITSGTPTTTTRPPITTPSYEGIRAIYTIDMKIKNMTFDDDMGNDTTDIYWDIYDTMQPLACEAIEETAPDRLLHVYNVTFTNGSIDMHYNFDLKGRNGINNAVLEQNIIDVFNASGYTVDNIQVGGPTFSPKEVRNILAVALATTIVCFIAAVVIITVLCLKRRCKQQEERADNDVKDSEHNYHGPNMGSFSSHNRVWQSGITPLTGFHQNVVPFAPTHGDMELVPTRDSDQNLFDFPGPSTATQRISYTNPAHLGGSHGEDLDYWGIDPRRPGIPGDTPEGFDPPLFELPSRNILPQGRFQRQQSNGSVQTYITSSTSSTDDIEIISLDDLTVPRTSRQEAPPDLLPDQPNMPRSLQESLSNESRTSNVVLPKFYRDRTDTDQSGYSGYFVSADNDAFEMPVPNPLNNSNLANNSGAIPKSNVLRRIAGDNLDPQNLPFTLDAISLSDDFLSTSISDTSVIDDDMNQDSPQFDDALRPYWADEKSIIKRIMSSVRGKDDKLHRSIPVYDMKRSLKMKDSKGRTD